MANNRSALMRLRVPEVAVCDGEANCIMTDCHAAVEAHPLF